MEDQTIFNALIGSVGVLFGWLINGIKKDITKQGQESDDLAKKVHSIEVLVVGDYVKHSDFDRTQDIMFKKMDHIIDVVERTRTELHAKLESKADKVKT